MRNLMSLIDDFLAGMCFAVAIMALYSAISTGCEYAGMASVFLMGAATAMWGHGR